MNHIPTVGGVFIFGPDEAVGFCVLINFVSYSISTAIYGFQVSFVSHIHKMHHTDVKEHQQLDFHGTSTLSCLFVKGGVDGSLHFDYYIFVWRSHP